MTEEAGLTGCTLTILFKMIEFLLLQEIEIMMETADRKLNDRAAEMHMPRNTDNHTAILHRLDNIIKTPLKFMAKSKIRSLLSTRCDKNFMQLFPSLAV